MKYCAIDIETTGLEIHQSQILEIAIIFDDLDKQLPFDDIPKFHRVIVSREDVVCGNAQAIALNWRVINLLAERNKLQRGFKEFVNSVGGTMFSKHTYVGVEFSNWLYLNKIDKIQWAGKNAASFDIPFCKRHLKGFEELHQYHRVIDVGNLYLNLNDDNEIPDLKTCLKRAGLGEPTQLHSALGDAWDVVRLVRARKEHNV